MFFQHGNDHVNNGFRVFLGTHKIQRKMSWSFEELYREISKPLYIMGTVKQTISCYHLEMLFNTVVQLHILYGIILKAARLISKSEYNAHTAKYFKAYWRYSHCTAKFTFNCVTKTLPRPIMKHFTQTFAYHDHNTGQSQAPHVNKPNSCLASNSILHQGLTL